MFITIEGIEGSGKTSQMEHMARFLKNNCHDCVVTREPGGTNLGEKVRGILLDPESKGIDPKAELLLYLADRAQHIQSLIKPLLSSGKTVLCDRYYDATLVYQGFGRGLDIGLISKLHKLIFDDLKPDITILLDLPPEIGLARAWNQIKSGQRAGIETRFEEEALLFHEKVRAGYLELANREPARYRIIDARQNKNQVGEAIIKELSLVLGFA